VGKGKGKGKGKGSARPHHGVAAIECMALVQRAIDRYDPSQ
jgi:hypothetical protein